MASVVRLPSATDDADGRPATSTFADETYVLGATCRYANPAPKHSAIDTRTMNQRRRITAT